MYACKSTTQQGTPSSVAALVRLHKINLCDIIMLPPYDYVVRPQQFLQAG